MPGFAWRQPARLAGLPLAVLLAALPGIGYAQNARLASSVDQQDISVGDTIHFTLSLTASGLGSVPTVTLGDMSGFEVVGKQTSQSLSDGQSKFDWVYTLVARRAGDLTIGAADVRIGNMQGKSAPVTVHVTSPFGQTTTVPPPAGGVTVPQGGIDVKLTVDRPTAFVGEQVTLTFTLVQGTNIYGSIGFEPPAAEGCVFESLPAPETQRMVSVDREIVVIKRQWALFAAGPGEHVIRPAAITFRRDFAAQEERLQSRPVTVNFRALPPNSTGYAFGGAVGNFNIVARCDKAQLQAGEGASLTVTVSGNGNLSSLDAPKPIVPDWCKIYPAGEKRDVTAKNTGDRSIIVGTDTFSYLLVPRAEGTLRIATIPLVYFDVATRAYSVSRTEPISLRVTPGDVIPEQERQFGDIGAISLSVRGAMGHAPLLFRHWFLALNALPLLALLIAGAQRTRALAVERNPASARFSRAGTRARQRIHNVRETDKRVFGELESIVRDYVSDKLNLPQRGSTVEELRAILLQRGVDAGLVNRTTDLLDRLQNAGFSPGDPSAQECAAIREEVRELISLAERRGVSGGA